MTERMAKLDRLLALINALSETTEGLTLDDMAARLIVNRRTAERMRDIFARHSAARRSGISTASSCSNATVISAGCSPKYMIRTLYVQWSREGRSIRAIETEFAANAAQVRTA
jgi:hypothetical protein